MKKNGGGSIFLLPFKLLWAFVSLIFGITGRIIAFVVAVACLALGTLLTGTVVGAVAGIPLIIVGIFLLVRSLF